LGAFSQTRLVALPLFNNFSESETQKNQQQTGNLSSFPATDFRLL
jgi:hypothetical protein